MKGKVRIAGKEYDCEVIDGERYINGFTVIEFLQTLSRQATEDLAEVGKRALENERNEEFGGLQDLADALHSRRVN